MPAEIVNVKTNDINKPFTKNIKRSITKKIFKQKKPATHLHIANITSDEVNEIKRNCAEDEASKREKQELAKNDQTGASINVVSDEEDVRSKRKTDFMSLLEKINFLDYHPQQFTVQDALLVCKAIPENEILTDPKVMLHLRNAAPKILILMIKLAIIKQISSALIFNQVPAMMKCLLKS
jgi:hypothetical protein